MQTLDPEICKAVTKTVLIGPGYMTDFAVNGKILMKKVVWKQYCVCDANYGGIIADNKIVQRLNNGDTWSCKHQEVKGTAINGVDVSLLTEDVEKLKKRTKTETNINV